MEKVENTGVLSLQSWQQLKIMEVFNHRHGLVKGEEKRRHRIHNTTDYYPKGKIIKKGVMRLGSSFDASTQYKSVYIYNTH